MSEDADWTLPSIPSEHKSIAPYFQRAQELKTKDPIMAYWCTLYGVEKGVASKHQNTQFLSQVVNILEKMKSNLAKYEAVTSNEAGSDYVEKFAMRVFSQADNEVRSGTATRSTAKKFLASAHFFEVLGVFDSVLRADISEKIKYARWNAVNLAKLSREGNRPASAEIDCDRGLMFSPASQDGVEAGVIGHPPSSTFAWSPNASITPSPVTQDRKSLEISPPQVADAPLPSINASGGSPVQPSFSSEALEAQSSLPNRVDEPAWSVSPPRTPPSRIAPLGLHVDRETPGMWSNVATPGIPDNEDIDYATTTESREDVNHALSDRSNWPLTDLAWQNGDKLEAIKNIEVKPISWQATTGRVVKRVHFTPSVKGGSSASSSIDDGSPPASLRGESPGFYAPSLPTVEEAPQAIFEGDDDAKDVLDEKALPNIPHQLTPSETVSSLPSPPVSVPSPLLSHLPQVTPLHPTSSLYTITPPPLQPSSPEPATRASVRSRSSPEELTTIQISRIQKHCRFAISALDYEDPETARRELRAALDMLGEY